MWIHLKHQVLFSLENNEKIFKMSSAAVIIGPLRVKHLSLSLWCLLMTGLTVPCFSAIFTKVYNFCDFLFASHDHIALQTWGLLLKERICSYKQILFFIELTSFDKGSKKKKK